MGFLGVYRVIYDYSPQADGELALKEDDLLFVIENNADDGWWKAKKKAAADDDDEPIGLIPNNYIEKAPPITHARALYEYTRQTDEELSFDEDANLEVYDTSDEDWILVGLDDEYGFVPANYIEVQSERLAAETPSMPFSPSLPSRPQIAAPELESSPVAPPAPAAGPAAALAGVMQGQSAPEPATPPLPTRTSTQRDSAPGSDDESVRSPVLPTRPQPAAEQPSYHAEPPPKEEEEEAPPIQRTPGGFHMYNISEMISVLGKRKKVPTTLGVNLGTGVILIAPERAADGPSQEWTADRMAHYSREGKHVFMELVRPSKSIDFHAGAKDTAEEIVAALGELAGAVRAEGLREVIMAGSKKNRRKGQIVYDFRAQGDDEVTVAAGDEVFILDDSKSEEWWQVRRLKNGKEGVVPSSYVEITGTITPPPASQGHDAAISTVEKNRLDEVRLTKEAMKAGRESQQRDRRENGHGERSTQSRSKPKPDSSKVRTWTDRSGSFSVEAQFLGLKDGKIHLHKMNGVKIAVPIVKMSREDIDYVEAATGLSLAEKKPSSTLDDNGTKLPPRESSRAGAAVAVEQPRVSDYDWFQFFLDSDVAVGLCERYAQAFIKGSMDESVLPDVDASVLRNLGIREGDIIKVMRHLDGKFGRDKLKNDADGEGGSGGLFSGPGGTLRNNTRKGRPAPAVQISDTVDAAAFSPRDGVKSPGDRPQAAATPPPDKRSEPQQPSRSGFDDDAWDVKPTKQQELARNSPAQARPETAPPVQTPALTGSLQELSLLTQPLKPTPTPSLQAPPASATPAAQPQQPQPTGASIQSPGGATPAFFAGNQQTGVYASAASQLRQRPTPPTNFPAGQAGILPPAPQRPLSAPQSAQQSAFTPPALAPQITGALQGHPAPAGQSLGEINQARLQQQYALQYQQQQQQQQQQPQFQQAQFQQPQATGFQPQGINSFPAAQFIQPAFTGAPGPSPFADPNRPNQFSPIQTQPTGYQPGFPNAQAAFGQQPTGSVNSFLPQPLEPQRTATQGFQGIPSQPTGFGGFNAQTQPPPVQPLQPQPTGPPPAVRFGVQQEVKKLTPQATGRKANLSQATPQNPFGF